MEDHSAPTAVQLQKADLIVAKGDQVEIVVVFPNYATAHAAWKAKAQQTVDNAHMRYFVVHLHRLLDPGQDTKPAR